MDQVAVLIPCYNESKTITKVVSDWRSVMPEAVIYVYDNNSTDGTAELALAAGAVVRKEPLQGKGNVVRRMLQEIDAECYLMVDGDDTYPAEEGPAMAAEILNGSADMVIGDRLSSTYFEENKRPMHNLGNSLVRGTINLLFASNIRDIMTGYRAFSYRFAKAFPVVSAGFEIETEMTIFAVDKNMALKNHVITYRDRPEGSVSKLNTVSDGIKVIFTILRLYCDYRPLPFFSLISGLLMVLALAFFIPVFSEYLQTGIVLRFPTLIVCGFCALAAIVSFFVGLLLATIQRNERRDFEFKLHQIEQWKR